MIIPWRRSSAAGRADRRRRTWGVFFRAPRCSRFVSSAHVPVPRLQCRPWRLLLVALGLPRLLTRELTYDEARANILTATRSFRHQALQIGPMDPILKGEKAMRVLLRIVTPTLNLIKGKKGLRHWLWAARATPHAPEPCANSGCKGSHDRRCRQGLGQRQKRPKARSFKVMEGRPTAAKWG